MKIVTPNTNLSAGSLSGGFIKDGAVTTAKILDANVTTAKILDGAVTGAKIADGAITSAKIGVDVIIAEDIANNAITVAELQDNAVTTAKILDANVTEAKIADGSITAAKIADGTIIAQELASDSVTTAKILDANVTTAKILDANVTADKLASDSVTTAKILDANVTLAKISTSGASDNQILVYDHATTSIGWETPSLHYTDAEAVDAWEAEGVITSTSDNKDLIFTKSVTRGSDGYTWWGHDEFWIGDSTGIVIENHEISSWGSTNPALVLGGSHSTNGIIVDEQINFETTNHSSATAIFNMPVEMNNPLQVDSTSVFNMPVTINDESKISGSANLTAPILHLETDNSGWNRPGLMLTDVNDDAVSIVGRNNIESGQENYQLNYTMDPNNNQPRTNVGGDGNTYAGDYFFGFMKDYRDTDEILMRMRVYGAHNGFNIEAYDDANGTNWSGDGREYNPKPIRLKGSQVEIATNWTERLVIDDDRTTLSHLLKLHNASGDPSGTTGDCYFNTTSGKVKVHNGTEWKTLAYE